VTCISELAIDRLLAGELAPLEATAAREHSARCTRCGALLDDAVSVQTAFVAGRPALHLPTSLLRRRTVSYAVAGALAAAALLVLVVGRRQHEEPTGTAIKGTPVLGFFVSHDGVVRRGGAGERVAPGDRIEIATTSHAPGWLTVVSVDGAGVRTVYVPTRPYAGGRDEVVPFAIELDGTLGLETVTATFCATPDGRDCTTDQFTMHKESR